MLGPAALEIPPSGGTQLHSLCNVCSENKLRDSVHGHTRARVEIFVITFFFGCHRLVNGRRVVDTVLAFKDSEAFWP